MDITALIKFITPFLPFLLKSGNSTTEAAAESTASKFEEATWQKAQAIWIVLSPRVNAKETAKEAVTDVANNPEDEDCQAALRVQLKKFTANDEDLAKQLTAILKANTSDNASAIQLSKNVKDDQNQTISQISGRQVFGNVTGSVLVSGSGNSVNSRLETATYAKSISTKASAPYVKTILVLASNPKESSRLRLGEEIREIQAGLERSSYRDQFRIEQRWAVRPRDIKRALLDCEPQIVHFSGHGVGARSEGLLLEDASGYAKLVSTEAISGLFSLFSESIECVLLSACYSATQADAIAQHIPYVIGVKEAFGYRAAIEFTIGFYDALSAGESIEFAYQMGRIASETAGSPGTLSPVLIKKGTPSAQQYDQVLQQYADEFLAAVQKKYPLDDETRHRFEDWSSVIGMSNEERKSIETRVEDVEEIRLSVDNQSIQNWDRLAQAIVRRIGATDLSPIIFPDCPNHKLWEITLPSTVLQLKTQTAIFCLGQENNPELNDPVEKIARQQTDSFLFFASVTDACLQGVAPLSLIWISPSTLMEAIEIPENDQLFWFTRFLFSQINAVMLPGILPYKTKGIAELFFGRENELARITSSSQRGAVIIGAHRSGKTSFLQKLKEKLQQKTCKIIGPYTFFDFQSFYKDTLDLIDRDLLDSLPSRVSLEDWSSALKAYTSHHQKTRLIFLLDEVDRMILEDLKNESNLGHQMRALQNSWCCEFFLAGHAQLREAIAIEGGPFRNFAEEITFTGLTTEAATDLIQKPMELLGFEVSDVQASRIYEGTAGVAVLIQEFCLKVLDEIRLSNAIQVDDTAIEAVEQSPDFLDIVFDHYKYAQTWDSMAITVLTAIEGDIQRKNIDDVFKKFGVAISRDRIDKSLSFLRQFGVLKKMKNGHFRMLPTYLTDAINIDDPESLIESELSKGRAA